MQWWLVVPKVEKGLQLVAAKVGFWDGTFVEVAGTCICTRTLSEVV